LIPNPILKVLSTLTTSRAKYLLMGGQACVFYGAAEFSRATDIALLSETENLARLSESLDELQAQCIAVPPFEAHYLKRGHAVHFRCQHPEARGMRVDVMSVMRGVESFDRLWTRRTTVELESGIVIELMSRRDLVAAKKTQRDKDWPMVRRLVEASYAEHRHNPVPEHIDFWLQECRTSAILLELARTHPDQCRTAIEVRPLLSRAMAGDEAQLRDTLDSEEKLEREADRAYWAPLLAELEELRRQRLKK
jgi:hypothetical protein